MSTCESTLLYRNSGLLLKFTNSSSDGIFYHLWGKQHAAEFGSLLMLPELGLPTVRFVPNAAEFGSLLVLPELGLPTVRFLTSLQYAKNGGRGEAWEYLLHERCQCLSRWTQGEGSVQPKNTFFVPNNTLQLFSTWIVTARKGLKIVILVLFN